jgi:hypothetical protein
MPRMPVGSSGPSIVDDRFTDNEVLIQARGRFTGQSDEQIIVCLSKALARVHIELNEARGKPRSSS